MNHSDSPVPNIDDDFLCWMEQQTALLQRRQFAQLDHVNLLSELEAIVSSLKHALASRLRVLLIHLLKSQFQPHMRSASWVRTICTQRNKIDQMLEESPSLRSLVLVFAHQEYGRAVRQAAKETGMPKDSFPTTLPYAVAQLLDFDFFP